MLDSFVKMIGCTQAGLKLMDENRGKEARVQGERSGVVGKYEAVDANLATKPIFFERF